MALSISLRWKHSLPKVNRSSKVVALAIILNGALTNLRAAAGMDADHISLVAENGGTAIARIGGQLRFADDCLYIVAGVFVSELFLVDGAQRADRVVPHRPAGSRIADEIQIVARLTALRRQPQGLRAVRHRVNLDQTRVAFGISAEDLGFDPRSRFDV